MTDSPWPEDIADFYRDLSLNDSPLESITQMHDIGLQVRRWKRIAGGLAVVCAAIVTASSIALTSHSRGPVSFDDSSLADNSIDPESTLQASYDDHGNTQGHADTLPDATYDLIAVRIHRDGCGKCKQMGNVFAEIQHDLDGRRVLFLTYDLTDEVTTKQSLLLGSLVEIKAPLEELESGNIALLTPDGRFIELLDGTSGRQKLTTQIAMQL